MVEVVSEETIRSAYAASQYPALIQKGRLLCKLQEKRHLKSPTEKGLPWCTHSEILRYQDIRGEWLVIFHQYRKPDGTLGASGMPDPKRLKLGNRILSSWLRIAEIGSADASEPLPPWFAEPRTLLHRLNERKLLLVTLPITLPERAEIGPISSQVQPKEQKKSPL